MSESPYITGFCYKYYDVNLFFRITAKDPTVRKEEIVTNSY